MKKDIAQFLIQKEFESWVNENPKMLDDARALCHDALMFNVKWGIPLKIVPDEEALNTKETTHSGDSL